jgi:four helix bundle protein
MEARTMEFGLRVLKLSRALPRSVESTAVRGQLVRCGTSVGANYRAAGHARSRAEFRAKLGIVEEEADEACYWLELIVRDGMMPASRVEPLLEEARQILQIVIASLRTSKSRPD